MNDTSRFTMTQKNVPATVYDQDDAPNTLHALYEIEDTSQAGDRRVLASGLRYDAARMIVVALNYAT